MAVEGVNTFCDECPAGTYSAAGASVCTDCEAGKFKEVAGVNIACDECEAGKFSELTGQTSSATCIDCMAGTYSAAGASFCTDCEAGKYSAAGAAFCTDCEAGKNSVAGAPECTTE
jgi:hypothetical protein